MSKVTKREPEFDQCDRHRAERKAYPDDFKYSYQPCIQCMDEKVRYMWDVFTKRKS